METVTLETDAVPVAESYSNLSIADTAPDPPPAPAVAAAAETPMTLAPAPAQPVAVATAAAEPPTPSLPLRSASSNANVNAGADADADAEAPCDGGDAAVATVTASPSTPDVTTAAHDPLDAPIAPPRSADDAAVAATNTAAATAVAAGDGHEDTTAVAVETATAPTMPADDDRAPMPNPCADEGADALANAVADGSALSVQLDAPSPDQQLAQYYAAWPVSPATQRWLDRAADVAQGHAKPTDLAAAPLTAPHLAFDQPLGDPIRALLALYTGEEEAAKMRASVLSWEDVPLAREGVERLAVRADPRGLRLLWRPHTDSCDRRRPADAGAPLYASRANT